MTSIESAGFNKPVDLRGHTGGGGLEAARVGMPGVDSMHYDQSMGWLVVRGSHGLVTVPKSNIKWMRPSDQPSQAAQANRGIVSTPGMANAGMDAGPFPTLADATEIGEAIGEKMSKDWQRYADEARSAREEPFPDDEAVTAVTRKKRGKRKR